MESRYQCKAIHRILFRLPPLPLPLTTLTATITQTTKSTPTYEEYSMRLTVVQPHLMLMTAITDNNSCNSHIQYMYTSMYIYVYVHLSNVDMCVCGCLDLYSIKGALQTPFVRLYLMLSPSLSIYNISTYVCVCEILVHR